MKKLLFSLMINICAMNATYTQTMALALWTELDPTIASFNYPATSPGTITATLGSGITSTGMNINGMFVNGVNTTSGVAALAAGDYYEMSLTFSEDMEFTLTRYNANQAGNPAYAYDI
ncbi:MAG: hypothetical protein ACK5NG_08965, partial [Chthoniobacterales bacterium]